MSAIIIADQVRIPAWVVDLDSFRRWTRSDDFPQLGRFAYLQGQLWVDLNREELFTHNLLKTEFTTVVGALVRGDALGYLFSDGALLTHPGVELSTESDLTFVSWEAIRSGRVRLLRGADDAHVEIEGTPDAVVEIVSRTSVRKDTEILRDLYWRAGIPEYWLVDARKDLAFDILRHQPPGYVPAPKDADGWMHSQVFDRLFRLTRETDPLGNPRFVLSVRPRSD